MQLERRVGGARVPAPQQHDFCGRLALGALRLGGHDNRTWNRRLQSGTRAPPQPLFGSHAARALLLGPEGSPEQAGGLLERGGAAAESRGLLPSQGTLSELRHPLPELQEQRVAHRRARPPRAAASVGVDARRGDDDRGAARRGGRHGSGHGAARPHCYLLALYRRADAPPIEAATRGRRGSQ